MRKRGGDEGEFRDKKKVRERTLTVEEGKLSANSFVTKKLERRNAFKKTTKEPGTCIYSFFKHQRLSWLLCRRDSLHFRFRNDFFGRCKVESQLQ